MLGIQVCGQQSSLKPRARCCFAAAKLDFGSCLLGSIPHTSVKLNCQKHGAFQVDGWTWDIASFAVLSRIFRGSFAKFGCQKWQVQILNLNWALATCSLQRTLQPELRHPTPTAETQGFHYTSCVNFPLVHSHWTKQTIWNILNFSFATFREANYFRDLSRPSISLSRKWCSTTPLHKQYIEVFFVAHVSQLVARVLISLWGFGCWRCVRSTLRNRPQSLACGPCLW